MILSDKRILEEIEKKTIVIKPYDREKLGSNSYDVHLGKELAVYKDKILDAKKHNEIEHFEIPEEGFVLQPDAFTWALPQNILKRMRMFLFLKANLLQAALALIYMLLREKVMLDFAATGRWKFPVKSR